MKAIVYTKYGSPAVLQLKEVEKPVPKSDEVLLRIFATTVNRTDCATIRAKPFFLRIITGLLRPKMQIPGSEFAGVVEEVGEDVRSLTAGDRIFGFNDLGAGSHAEFMTIREDYAIKMPDDMSYAQATASSEGAHYAYNFINKVELDKDCKILVNGATGAIGSAAVQLLKYFEVNVTAVCATKNIELVRGLGADKIIDYANSDFTQDKQKYDYVFDTVGKSSFFKCKGLLKSRGGYISSDLGYMAQNLFLPIVTSILGPLLGYKKSIFPNPVDINGSLQLIKNMMVQGKFKAVIDSEYMFTEIVEAYKYVEKGQKTGNVVIILVNNELG